MAGRRRDVWTAGTRERFFDAAPKMASAKIVSFFVKKSFGYGQSAGGGQIFSRLFRRTARATPWLARVTLQTRVTHHNQKEYAYLFTVTVTVTDINNHELFYHQSSKRHSQQWTCSWSNFYLSSPALRGLFLERRNCFLLSSVFWMWPRTGPAKLFRSDSICFAEMLCTLSWL